MKGEMNHEGRPAALERPEAKDERVVRTATRFFGIAAEEGLTPYEMAVAWQRIARTILRESLWKISMGAFLRHLAREIIDEMPTVPGLLGGGDEERGRGGERPMKLMLPEKLANRLGLSPEEVIYTQPIPLEDAARGTSEKKGGEV